MVKYNKWLTTVVSSPETDGGGPLFVPLFYNLLKDTKIDTLFEWCCGNAWIGIYLLEHGICNKLVLADIDKKSIDNAYNTLKNKGLLNKAKLYLSKNLDHIDKDERFDVVVANPPNYCNIRGDHSLGHAKDDLGTTDHNWQLHEDFYNKIGAFLNKDAKMYISEAEPESSKIYLVDKFTPYDDRIIRPLLVFKKMIKDNGFKLNRVIKKDIRQDFDTKHMIDRLYPYPMLDSNKRIITDFSVLDISV